MGGGSSNNLDSLFDPTRLRGRWGEPTRSRPEPTGAEEKAPDPKALVPELRQAIENKLGARWLQPAEPTLEQIAERVAELFPDEGEPLAEDELQTRRDELLLILDEFEDLLEALMIARG